VGGQLPEQLNFTWKRKILSLVFEMLSISPFNLITKFYFLEFKNSDLDHSYQNQNPQKHKIKQHRFWKRSENLLKNSPKVKLANQPQRHPL